MGMAFLRLLLIGNVLIAVISSTLSTDKKIKIESDITDNRYFPSYIIPEEAIFNLQVKDSFIHGESITIINITHTTTNITLLQPPGIYQLSIEVTETLLRKENVQEITHKNLFLASKVYRTIFYFKNELRPREYILKIKYLFTIADDARNFFVFSYINEKGINKSLVIGDLKEIRVRYALPCFFEPRLKELIISINYSEIYTVLSNVAPEVKYTIDDDVTYTHIRITSAMSTHFVAIPMSDFDSFSNIFEKINMWCRRNMKQYMNFAWNIVKSITTYLQYKLYTDDLDKNFKEDQLHVVIPHFQEDIMTWGLVFYREVDIMYEESDHGARKIEVARLVTRKVVHEWLGISGVHQQFDNMQSWLNAGFLTFFEVYVIDKIFDNSRMMDLFVVQNQHESLYLASDFNINSLQVNNISEINLFSVFSNYTQAPFILRMLQHLITDEVFWEGIRKCVNVHGFNLTNPDAFWIAMQAALDESGYRDKFNLTNMLDSWTKQRCSPVLNIVRHYNNDTISITIQNLNSVMHNCSIPVTFASQSKPDFTNTSLHNVIWLHLPSQHIPLHLSSSELVTDLKDDDWIIANLQQAGHYRINYDIENWLRIAKYLDSRKYRNIHVLNRVQIIDDAFYFAIEKKLLISIFWDVAIYLPRDTDYVAWYPMIKAVEYMSSTFPLPDKSTNNIKNKINEILYGLFKKIRCDELNKTECILGDFFNKIRCDELNRTGCFLNDDDFIWYLKQELAKWTCTLELFYCISMAKFNLEWHLINPEKNKLLPWWKEWTYCKGLMSANDTIWHQVMNKVWMKNRDKKILEFLACSQSTTIIKKYLLRKASEMKLQDNEHVYSFHSIIAKHARNDEILIIIISNFSQIKPKRISIIAAIIDIINHVYSKQELVKIHKLMQYLDRRHWYNFDRKRNTRLSQLEKQVDLLEILSEIKRNDTELLVD